MKARENPFRTERVLLLRYRLEEGTWEDLLARLNGLGRRAAVVGPKGSGKTTFLEDLAARLETRGFRARALRLDEDNPSFPDGFLRAFFAGLGPRDVVLLDGAERLGPLAWRRFERGTRRAAGLVIAAHQRGRLPVLLECRPTPDLLDGLLRELLGGEAEGLRGRARALYDRHGGDLREVMRSLYDFCAAR